MGRTDIYLILEKQAPAAASSCQKTLSLSSFEKEKKAYSPRIAKVTLARKKTNGRYDLMRFSIFLLKVVQEEFPRPKFSLFQYNNHFLKREANGQDRDRSLSGFGFIVICVSIWDFS
jgi:hypothetical protein